jgi:hypothetical protein
MTFPNFSAGEILRAQDMNAVSGWLISTTTIGNGVTSVPVNDCFPTDYDVFRIIIENLDTNGTASHDIQLQGITGSVYFTGGNLMGWGGGTITGYGPAAQTTWFVSANVAASTGTVVTLDLWNPNNTRRKYAVSHGLAGNGHCMLNLYSTSNSSATGFTLAKGGNTMTGGTIRVYGYKK